MKLKTLLWSRYVPGRLNLSHSSAKQIEFVVNSFSGSVGQDAEISHLTEENLHQWVRSMLERLSRSTVRRHRARLLTLWRFAHRKKLADAPPALEPVRVPKRIPKAWTISEFEAILRQCRSLKGTMPGHPEIHRKDWWTSLHLFLYDSGARLNAALSVKSADMAIFQCACLLRAESAKTWMEQVVHFSSQTAEAVSAIYDPEREFVWPYKHGRRHLFHWYKKILAAAGVDHGKYVGFHRLRKMHATQAVLASGWEAASRDLGHTSTRMTAEYVDLRQIKMGAVSLPRPRLI